MVAAQGIGMLHIYFILKRGVVLTPIVIFEPSSEILWENSELVLTKY